MHYWALNWTIQDQMKTNYSSISTHKEVCFRLQVQLHLYIHVDTTTCTKFCIWTNMYRYWLCVIVSLYTKLDINSSFSYTSWSTTTAVRSGHQALDRVGVLWQHRLLWRVYWPWPWPWGRRGGGYPPSGREWNHPRASCELLVCRTQHSRIHTADRHRNR